MLVGRYMRGKVLITNKHALVSHMISYFRRFYGFRDFELQAQSRVELRLIEF